MDQVSTFLRSLLKWFVSGLLVLLPLGATLILLGWILNFLDSLIGGQSFFGQIWKSGFGWLNLGDTILFLIAYLFVITFITVVGYFAQGFARNRLASILRNFFDKIPVLNKIYGSFEQLINLWAKKEKGEEIAKIGEVVIVNFCSVKALGVLSSRSSFTINGEEHYLVYLPSSPIPATGFTYFFKESDIKQCDIKMDDMTKIIVSLGVLGHEALGKEVSVSKMGEKPPVIENKTEGIMKNEAPKQSPEKNETPPETTMSKK